MLLTIAFLASASFVATNKDKVVEEKKSVQDVAPETDLGSPYVQSMINQDRTDVKNPFDGCEEDDEICLLHQRLRAKRIKQFQNDLLKKLNMKEPPNVSKSDLPSQLAIDSLKKRYGIDRMEKLSEINSRKVKIETKELISFAKLGESICYVGFYCFKNLLNNRIMNVLKCRL